MSAGASEYAGLTAYEYAVVSDVLKRDPCDGEIYAFCSKPFKQITAIYWQNGAICCTKMPKAKGRYIWPESSGVRTGCSATLPMAQKQAPLLFQSLKPLNKTG